MTETTPQHWPRSTPLLWVEFVSIFILAPVAALLVLERTSPIAILLGVTLLALWLLWRTPDFRMSELLRGPVLGEWKLILGFTAFSALALSAIALALVPDRFLGLVRDRPELWLMIMLLYPVFSALPQEIIFRTLFFRRYARLFRSPQVALIVNVSVFVLAHVFFENAVTLVITAAGGFVFAWAYLRNHSTLLATVLHSIGGQLIFTSGLGVYFYHGALGTV